MLSQTMELILIFINALVVTIKKIRCQMCTKFNTINTMCYDHLTGNVISVETKCSKCMNMRSSITSNGQVGREFHNTCVKLQVKGEPHSMYMQCTFKSRELSFLNVYHIECYSKWVHST